MEDLTDFKPLGKRVRNNIVYLIAVISADLNKLKTYVIVVVNLSSELSGELNTLLITL